MSAARFNSSRFTMPSDKKQGKKHDPVDYVAQKDTLAPRRLNLTAAERVRRNINAKLANPLAGYTHDELKKQGLHFAITHQMGDEEDIRAFEMGAVLAQAPEKFEEINGLTEEELKVLRKEFNNRWSQPMLMYVVIVICSICAAVQGMDETVVNGAQVLYKDQFGIAGSDPRSTWLLGLLNAAPYLCCAIAGCWLTIPYNHWFGRRGTIFITCVISSLACIWQGFVNTWWHMFIARFVLGFGIGPKSATVPIYAAETSPPAIRGALVMQWQMWTAFGIMFGYAADLAFFNVSDPPNIVGFNWRLMMGSACIPAIIVLLLVFICPESPRWYMSKGRYDKAYHSMCRLRYTKLQAARDVYYIHTLLEAETNMKLGQNKIIELITVPRNRRALLASEIVMFLQQFCGVNVIAYYSSGIFLDANFSPMAAFSASLGWGVVNWLLAIPAIYTIDTFGRRNLLLSTFPMMAISMFFTGFSFLISEAHHTARIGCIALGIFLFGFAYSPGEGPVPFTYSAEAYPLYVRSYGMSLATATTWFFNFILAITWPSLASCFSTTGGFAWYGAWNVVGWWLVLMFMPETKGKTLEELDQVFSVPTRFHAAWGLRQIPYVIKRYIFRRNVQPEILYEKEDSYDPDQVMYRELGMLI